MLLVAKCKLFAIFAIYQIIKNKLCFLQINLTIFAITLIYFSLLLYTPNKAELYIGRKSQVGNLPSECQREASASTVKKKIAKKNNYFFLILFYTVKYTMRMLKEHSDALSLPSDVPRTSNFQKSVRSSVYKTSSSKRTYAVRHKAMNGKSLPKLWQRKG